MYSVLPTSSLSVGLGKLWDRVWLRTAGWGFKWEEVLTRVEERNRGFDTNLCEIHVKFLAIASLVPLAIRYLV